MSPQLRESPDTANFQLAAELGRSCAPSNVVAHSTSSKAGIQTRIENSCLAANFTKGILPQQSSTLASQARLITAAWCIHTLTDCHVLRRDFISPSRIDIQVRKR